MVLWIDRLGFERKNYNFLERLQEEQEILTPAGPTLYRDYYCYVRDHPVVLWQIPTAILYGSGDNLCEFEVVSAFADKFACDLVVMEKGEHYFHTPEQLQFMAAGFFAEYFFPRTGI